MIEFNEEKHEYRIRGEIVPSVSELLDRIMGSPYGNVPEFVLKKASEYGTEVHKMIEIYNETGMELKSDDPRMNASLEQWIELAKGIKVVSSEMMITYKHLYCGTFDAIGILNDKLTLFDYKTSRKLYMERTMLQLNLYRLGYEWMTGEKIKQLVVVWLPKDSNAVMVPLEILPDRMMKQNLKKALKE